MSADTSLAVPHYLRARHTTSRATQTAFARPSNINARLSSYTPMRTHRARVIFSTLRAGTAHLKGRRSLRLLNLSARFSCYSFVSPLSWPQYHAASDCRISRYDALSDRSAHILLLDRAMGSRRSRGEGRRTPSAHSYRDARTRGTSDLDGHRNCTMASAARAAQSCVCTLRRCLLRCCQRQRPSAAPKYDGKWAQARNSV